MIKGRQNKLLGVAPPSADLLVCFPARARLALMPKPISSPVRPSEPAKRHHLKRINTRTIADATGGPNSPIMWAKNNQMRPEIAEPTSPKVTCAGQIKVRHRSSSTCRNWQSVMGEIERIHNRGKHKKTSKWVVNFGFKKDVTNFLTCLRNLRFDFRCFGAFPEAVITSEDDDEDEDEDEEFEDDEFEIGEEENQVNNDNNTTTNNNKDSNAVFSKWFMVLQDDNQGKHSLATTLSKKTFVVNDEEVEDDESAPAVPPPNALLLMRCRSAPAKSWLEEKQDEEKENSDGKTEVKEEEEGGKKKHRRRESLGILMKYDDDFDQEIVQETCIVGEFKDAFYRSRSWRR